MSIQLRLDEIIGHLGAAVVQRSSTDDAVIANHIDMALAAARLAKREVLSQRIAEARDRGQRVHDEWLARFAAGYLRDIAQRQSDLHVEHQLDHQDKIDNNEVRTGQRVP